MCQCVVVCLGYVQEESVAVNVLWAMSARAGLSGEQGTLWFAQLVPH
jgi:hypothetical protein